MRRRPELLLATLLWLAPQIAGATSALTAQQTTKSSSSSGKFQLSPSTGPITVTADHAEWQQGGMMVYTGHVYMASDNISLQGGRIELRQLPDGQYEARVTGVPARMAHAADSENPPVTAEALMLYYDSRIGTVEMTGDAMVERGTDVLTSDKIRYDIAARRIQAAGGDHGQVRIVINPPEKKAGNPSEKTR